MMTLILDVGTVTNNGELFIVHSISFLCVTFAVGSLCFFFMNRMILAGFTFYKNKCAQINWMILYDV